MRLLLSIILSIFTWILFCQNKPCSYFKTGEFKYSNSEYAEWTIIRTDSIQIEVSSKSGTEIYSLIEWKSDCEYTLTCEKVLNSNSNQYDEAVGKVFNVFITETLYDRYKCNSKSNENQINELKLEMIKTK